jgi:hypothetical protein
MPISHSIKPEPRKELFQLRGTPVRCLDCGGMQIAVAGTSLPANCDRWRCEGDNVEQCGPAQLITIIVFSDGGKK